MITRIKIQFRKELNITKLRKKKVIIFLSKFNLLNM